MTRLLLVLLCLVWLPGCEDLKVRDPWSLLVPTFHRSEIVGFVAGAGTTFAAVPDLVAMLRRRSGAGMNPRMVTIIGAFQLLWIYYGLLIHSRPVIAWNAIAVMINLGTAGAYRHFSKNSTSPSASSDPRAPASTAGSA
jgi:uncharacterized protein with PQ loop repeat